MGIFSPSFCTLGLSILRDKMMQLENIHSESLRALLTGLNFLRSVHVAYKSIWQINGLSIEQ